MSSKDKMEDMKFGITNLLLEDIKFHTIAQLLTCPEHLPFRLWPDIPKKFDGWYIWRLNKDYPVDSYMCIQVIDDIMYDHVPIDSEGAKWEIMEVSTHGEFFGPILLS